MRNVYGKRSKKKDFAIAIFVSAICLSAILMGTVALRHKNDKVVDEKVLDLNEEKETDEKDADSQNIDVNNKVNNKDESNKVNELNNEDELNKVNELNNEDELNSENEINSQNQINKGDTSDIDNMAPDREVIYQLDNQTYNRETEIIKVNNPGANNTQVNSAEVNNSGDNNTESNNSESNTKEIAKADAEEESKTSDVAAQTSPGFSDSSKLLWPVEGNIVLDYNMDNTIYFPTLDVYKCNPAVVIQSDIGTEVLAAADGRVEKVGFENEIGNFVIIDMGNGYKAKYGQIDSICIKEGDIVSKGNVIAKIAEQTKYYLKEGVNLYFCLTKDEEPQDPTDRFSDEK